MLAATTVIIFPVESLFHERDVPRFRRWNVQGSMPWISHFDPKHNDPPESSFRVKLLFLNGRSIPCMQREFENICYV